MEFQREPYMLVVTWKDPSRDDPDAPFCFGPYTFDEAYEAKLFIENYQANDNEPDEDLLICTLGTYKSPRDLRMFMAL